MRSSGRPRWVAHQKAYPKKVVLERRAHRQRPRYPAVESRDTFPEYVRASLLTDWRRPNLNRSKQPLWLAYCCEKMGRIVKACHLLLLMFDVDVVSCRAVAATSFPLYPLIRSTHFLILKPSLFCIYPVWSRGGGSCKGATVLSGLGVELYTDVQIWLV